MTLQTTHRGIAERAKRFTTSLARSNVWLALASLAAFVIVAWMAHVTLRPVFERTGTLGIHDWDVHAAYRYITVLSLKQYGEFPFWHPYFCGGYPAWGYVEGATNVVSPYLPLYLTLPMGLAMRAEIVGSALLGLGASALLASRFTRSIALCTLVAVVTVLNGRWTLQAGVGHTWHFQYAWLPLALYLFDTSLDAGRERRAVYAGVVLAMLVYMGGIYPLPHAALALGLYALFLAVAERTAKPLVALAVSGSVGVGLAAPKLFVLLEAMQRDPRKIDSTEALDLSGVLGLLTNPAQDHTVARISQWGFHEYGIYIGWGGFVLIALGALLGRGAKEQALRLTGLSFFVLGMGAFDAKYAPWVLLHKLPVFSSQHVPSRFLYPAVLALVLVAASILGRSIDRLVVRHRAWELVFLVPVGLIAADIVRVASRPLEASWVFEPPTGIAFDAEFHQLEKAKVHYTNGSTWYDPVYLSMLSNRGVIDCAGVPLYDSRRWGAVSSDAAGFRGEAYVVDGTGTATITRWSPNAATVHVEGATPGSLVVYNMNHDPNWRADGEPALERARLVAAPAPPSGTGDVHFRYRPRALGAGLGVFAITAFACVGAPLWRRRARPRPTSPGHGQPHGDPR